MTYPFERMPPGVLMINSFGEVMKESDISKDRFVDLVFITELTSLSDKWFYKMAQQGKFPKPVKFGRSSRWIEREVKEWLEARVNEPRA